MRPVHMDWKTPQLDGGIPCDIRWKNPPAAASELPSPLTAPCSKKPPNSSLDVDSWKRPTLTEDVAESECGKKHRRLTEDIAESGPNGKWKKSSTPLAPPCPQSTSSSWKTPELNDVPPPPTPSEETHRAPRHEVNMCRVMLQLILPGEVNEDKSRRMLPIQIESMLLRPRGTAITNAIAPSAKRSWCLLTCTTWCRCGRSFHV